MKKWFYFVNSFLMVCTTIKYIYIYRIKRYVHAGATSVIQALNQKVGQTCRAPGPVWNRSDWDIGLNVVFISSVQSVWSEWHLPEI